MKVHLFLVLIFSTGLPQATTARPNDLLISIKHIKSQILSSYSKCSHFSYQYESYIASNIHQRDDDSAAKLITDLSYSTGNMKEPPQLHQYQSGYIYRHHQPCALILYEVDALVLDNVHMLNNGTIGKRWPERIIPLLPTNVFNSFFIFFTNEIDCVSSIVPAMTDLMKQTAMLLNVLFAIPSCEGELNILSGFPQTSQPLQLVAKVKNNNMQVIDASRIYRKNYNFQGESFRTDFCVACTIDFEKLELEPRIGNTFNWAWILTLINLNATPLVETVFGIPENGLTVEGDFDDFLLPLLEGTAAMTSIFIPSPEVSHLVYLTKAYWLSNLCFMTALPGRDTSAGLYMMEEPFDWPVWLAIMVTMICLLGCFKLIMLSSGRNITFNLHLWLMDIIFCPMLSQGGFDDKTFRLRTAKSCKMHIMVGLWAAALIILNGAYTAILWDVIGYPRYLYPPRTLDELEKSDYEIGHIFGVDRDLRAVNNSRNLRLTDRLIEHDFTSTSCFQGIFERRMACMGYYSAFTIIGFEHMVDMNGELMAAVSTERTFFKIGGAGISKYYPMLLEPMNRYMTIVESSGLGAHTTEYFEASIKKKGQRNAKLYVDTKKYYAGPSSSLEKSQDDRKTVGIILQVLRAGCAASTALFLSEFAIYFIPRILANFAEDFVVFLL